MNTVQNASLVIMGVAGCGKSSLGAGLAQRLGLPLIEGDDHHSPASRQKMREGIALTDVDRAGWLATLADLLARSPGGVVLTCSALRRAYRDQLRAAAPGLRFVFIDITPALASERVATRSAHFFNTALVDSQFATLESPVGEPGVLRVDAAEPLPQLLDQAAAWAAAPSPSQEAA
ncbi:gluconokinase [Hydrogenophaga flava]|uniref:gluconokinase n=1 Tax=Hydrogenophaga flava TaxID=65657 RepID=UPI000A9A16C4|nr:gluconokinase [Hydrogenophaga flava]